ncbi:MAG TPA: DUF1003 domain-containing protein [Anaerolineales bacterium]|nr:DUF1003 domain-containing protein [Anaerolineales bacterium]
MTENSSSSLKKHHGRLAGIIEKNIHTIVHSRQFAANQRNGEERLADAITDFSGRMYFVYFHIVWFAVWILINLGYFGIKPFDPYPFGLLTMIVSLEAIFLSTFVLISQNRLSAEADRRADLDLQIGLLAEHELTRVLKMLDEIQDKMGIENDSDRELQDLEKNVHPEDVLAEIDRVQQRLNQRHT